MRKLANVMQNYIRLCAIASRGKVGFLNAHVCYVTVNLLRSTTKTDKLECNFIALRKEIGFVFFYSDYNFCVGTTKCNIAQKRWQPSNHGLRIGSNVHTIQYSKTKRTKMRSNRIDVI